MTRDKTGLNIRLERMLEEGRLASPHFGVAVSHSGVGWRRQRWFGSGVPLQFSCAVL